MCAAALLCSDVTRVLAAEDPTPGPVAVSNFPIASDVRLAGDAKQTRFVLDLDKSIQFRAFALADPYRVVVDLPQISFKLGAGAGTAGRGLIKAFRYGLVMPGGSRIVFDLTGPAKIAKSYVLEAANGQPPRLVLELEEVDRIGLDQEFYEILAAPVPHVTIPVKPGRDIARLIEVAALDQKLKALGQNSALEFNAKLLNMMDPGSK